MIMAFWGFVDVLLLAAAVASIALSVIWRQPNLLINLTLSIQHLNGMSSTTQVGLVTKLVVPAGLIMGVIMLVSWVISIGALIMPNNSITGFIILNWALVLDAISILVTGTSLWFYTLRIQHNYLEVWQAQSNATKIAVQDLVSIRPPVAIDPEIELITG